MRRIFLLVAACLLSSTFANAQAAPAKDLKPLFDAAQKLGIENELRGDIANRLGFGEDSLIIKDLVITKNGVQHAMNAFVVANKSYLLFDSHLQAPEIYVYVKTVDGAFVAGVRGRQYQPITEAVDLLPAGASEVAAAEEDFWFQWLADGAKLPVP